MMETVVLLHGIWMKPVIMRPLAVRLRNAGFSQLPVMDDERLVGVVTEDTIMQFVYGKPALMNAAVGDAMETAFIKLQRTESMNNLVAMLRVQPYAAIMDKDEFLGLVTRSDVLNYLRRLHQGN